MKKTEWYPANINPVHIGSYEVKYTGNGQIHSRHWNGEEWENAVGGWSAFGNNAGFVMPGEEWRGLTKEAL